MGAIWDNISCSGVDCGLCHAVQGTNAFLAFLVYGAAILIVLVTLYVGILYIFSGGNKSKIGYGTDMLKNVVKGFFIVILAFFVVDTGLKALLDDRHEAQYGPWNEVECVEQVSGELAPTPGGPGTTPPPDRTPPTTPGTREPGTLSHEEALALLQAAGVNVISSGIVAADCGGRTDCTSLEGIQRDTVQQIINLQNAVCGQSPINCRVTVTGATEPGHAPGEDSHGTGVKVDIRRTPAVDKFIRDNLKREGSRSGDERYTDDCGNEYVLEGDHWDVTVNSGSCGL